MNNTVDEESTKYVLGNVSGTSTEHERLDDLHEAFRSYLGGNLSLAPLEELAKPKRILEIGGAWAIQAAETFSEAEVLAIDISPLPARSLPSNLTFKIVDLTRPFPAELHDERYDIVHARLVFIHLPHPEGIIRRIAQLVKPGGWLLLDDAYQPRTVECDPIRSPGLSSFWKLLQDSQRARDMDPFIGARFKEILQSTGLFSEVNAKEILLPLSNPGINVADGAFFNAAKLS
ncbi:S-adenosyl-L-methionine-dependent methyltransferase [Hysterangium stoloniferum]|nr:S-adenosyl-L-methionine-dependent methyltransferase [Hysterangium stoloniferum]